MYMFSTMNSTCTSDEECSRVIRYGECKTEGAQWMCACRSGYYHDDDGVCQRNRIGTGGCSSNDHCLQYIANSNCTHGVCYCNSGYSVSQSNYSNSIHQRPFYAEDPFDKFLI